MHTVSPVFGIGACGELIRAFVLRGGLPVSTCIPACLRAIINDARDLSNHDKCCSTRLANWDIFSLFGVQMYNREFETMTP